MDFLSDGPALGGAHLSRFEPDSFDRPRYIKTPAQANAKWVASTATGQQTWVDNLNSTTKPITQAAVNARQLMQARFLASTAAGGPWETHLLARGDGYVKSQATKLAQNYGTGVAGASAKQLAAITKIIAYEATGLTQLPAKGGPGTGKARMDAWFDYMSAGRGSLGAV